MYSFHNIIEQQPFLINLVDNINEMVSKNINLITPNDKYSIISYIHDYINKDIFPDMQKFSILNEQDFLTFNIEKHEKAKFYLYSFDLRFNSNNKLEVASIIFFKPLKNNKVIVSYTFCNSYCSISLRNFKKPLMESNKSLVLFNESKKIYFMDSQSDMNIFFENKFMSRLEHFNELGNKNFDLIQNLIFTYNEENKDLFKLLYDYDVEDKDKILFIDINNLNIILNQKQKNIFYDLFKR